MDNHHTYWLSPIRLLPVINQTCDQRSILSSFVDFPLLPKITHNAHAGHMSVGKTVYNTEPRQRTLTIQQVCPTGSKTSILQLVTHAKRNLDGLPGKT